MTVLNIIETIQEIFDLGETQLIKEIDLAQKEYVKETKVLRKTGALQNTTTKITWSLPSDCIEVINVLFYDSDDLALDPYEDLDLAYDVIKGKLTFADTNGDAITGLPSEAAYVYVDYLYSPTSITARTDSLEISESLHDGVLAKVMKKLFSIYPVDMSTRDGVARIRDWNAVRYWDSVYKEKRVEGKREANIRQDAINRAKAVRNKLGEVYSLPIQRITADGNIS